MEEQKNQNEKINNDPELKVLRTYASDIAELVRQNDGSIAKIAIAEQEREQATNFYNQEKDTTKKKNIFLFIFGFIILGIAIYGSYYLYQTIENKKVVIPEKEKTESFISYDESAEIQTSNIFSNIELAENIKREIAKTKNPKTIKAIFLKNKNGETEEYLKTQEFINLQKLSMPDETKRSLTDKFMVGGYKENTDQSKTNLFLIFETNNYNLTYAGMLNWEKTILNDMFVLFDIDITGINNNLFEQKFKDIIINNKDARVLYNSENKEVLYYIFANKNKLIITDSKEAINEIITRLITKNTKPL